MTMQNFDPQVAARVWQRVCASQEKTCTEKPACPIEGIRTVPAVPMVPQAKQRCPKVQRKEHGGTFPIWLIILLLCM